MNCEQKRHRGNHMRCSAQHKTVIVNKLPNEKLLLGLLSLLDVSATISCQSFKCSRLSAFVRKIIYISISLKH
ncbi:UNVERIFIED_CONTAM: hypothetical protein K2H54_039187, partial [Gekko kuhli]